MASKLPRQLVWDDAQNKWATILDKVVVNPIINGQQLNDIVLKTGPNVINHKLGRKLQGWYVVGQNGPASIYDTQASNQLPALTLNLTSDADVTIAIWVY